MKGIKFAGALALALICGTWTTTSLDVLAVENTTIVTASQLLGAIENAESALNATAGVASVAGQATYLRGLVNEAKALSYDIEGNQDKNLGELVDALNEGARGIILLSGVNMKEEAAPTTQSAQNEATTGSARTVAAEVATTIADLGVAVTISADEPVAAKKTEVAEVSESEAEETEVAESAEGSEESLDEKDQVEVPKTGEDTPSPIAVGITVGVVVFVALAGALAIVKRIKRDA